MRVWWRTVLNDAVARLRALPMARPWRPGRRFGKLKGWAQGGSAAVQRGLMPDLATSRWRHRPLHRPPRGGGQAQPVVIWIAPSMLRETGQDR